MKSYGVTIQMKATEQYFPVVLFILLFKVVLTFDSVNKISNCDHLSDSLALVFYTVKTGIFWLNARFWHFSE